MAYGEFGEGVLIFSVDHCVHYHGRGKGKKYA